MQLTRALGVLLVIPVFLSQAYGEKSVIARAVTSVIRKSFVPNTSEFNFFIKCEDDPQRINYFFDLAEEILGDLSEIGVQFGNQLELPDNLELNYLVLVVDSPQAVRFLYKNLIDNFKTVGNYVLVVLKTFHLYYYDVLMEVLLEHRRADVLLVRVVVEPSPGHVLMFGFEPFTTHSCQQAVPVVMNNFNESSFKWEHEDFYPEMITDMKGCPLVIATVEYEPYFKAVKDDQNNVVLTGICGRFLSYFAESLNFTIKLYYMKPEEFHATLRWGNISLNTLFREKGIDIISGPLHPMPFPPDSVFKISAAYYRRRSGLVMSSRWEDVLSFELLVYPFVLSVWILIVAIFAVGVTLICVMNHLKRSHKEFIIGTTNSSPVYTMYTSALGGAHYRLPRHNFARYLFCMWMLLWINVRAGYQAALFHIISHNVPASRPDSMHEALEHGYTIVMDNLTYNALKTMPRLLAASEIFEGSDAQVFDRIRGETGKVAVLTADDAFDMYRKNHPEQWNDFYVAKSNFFILPMGLYYKRTFSQRFSIDSVIDEYWSIGMSPKVRRDILELSRDGKDESTFEFEPISGKNLIGAFQVFLIGCLLSFAVFLIEIFVYSVCQRNRKWTHFPCMQSL